MTIRYSEPLSHAWLRMKMLLFRPFNVGAWFVLGFGTFLISLAESTGAGSGSNLQERFTTDFDGQDFNDITGNFNETFSALMDTAGGLWLGLGMGLMVLLLVGVLFFLILFLWLSCRGRFMFVDNLIHQRSKISQPWSEFAAQADSLFLWQIAYSLITLTIVGVFGLMGIVFFLPLLAGDAGWLVTVPLVIFGGTMAFMYFIAMMYIDYFLTAFIVPIMHRRKCSTTQAWKIFLPLFHKHPGSFVLSGLFYLVISFFGGLAMFIVGVLTCCLGLLMMVIPYIGSVITLPYTVTLRYFTLNFLSQFGDEYCLLGPQPSNPEHKSEDGFKDTQPEAEVTDSQDNLIEFNDNGTVIGPEDIGENGSTQEPRPQD